MLTKKSPSRIFLCLTSLDLNCFCGAKKHDGYRACRSCRCTRNRVGGSIGLTSFRSDCNFGLRVRISHASLFVLFHWPWKTFAWTPQSDFPSQRAFGPSPLRDKEGLFVSFCSHDCIIQCNVWVYCLFRTCVIFPGPCLECRACVFCIVNRCCRPQKLAQAAYLCACLCCPSILAKRNQMATSLALASAGYSTFWTVSSLVRYCLFPFYHRKCERCT